MTHNMASFSTVVVDRRENPWISMVAGNVEASSVLKRSAPGFSFLWLRNRLRAGQTQCVMLNDDPALETGVRVRRLVWAGNELGISVPVLDYNVVVKKRPFRTFSPNQRY